jgi:hypothetical protein
MLIGTTIAAMMAFQFIVGTPGRNAKQDPSVAEKTPPPAAPRQPQWSSVKQWQGSGGKETESFTVASQDWRIDYSTQPQKELGGEFQIYVYSADSGRVVALPVNVRGKGQATNYVRAGPGRFYLKMSTSTNWTVGVEDKR